jgi:4-carboxymuconolactone decarboxylase
MTTSFSDRFGHETRSFRRGTAKANGISRTEIVEILTHLAFYAGWPKAWAVFRMAKEIWTE